MEKERQTVPAAKEVDSIGHYCNVATELAKEHFFGEDHHDSLTTQAGRVVSVTLEHPALFRSALSPFRRLWMVSEPSYYCYVRKILYRYQQPGKYDAYRGWYFAYYDKLLKRPLYPDIISIPNSELINIWINTQFAHAEKKSKTGNFTAREFDELSKKVGREVVEFAVRQGLRFIGSLYLNLHRQIALPELNRYEQEFGLKPSFIVGRDFQASSYKPLRRESAVQTLERLLQRQSYRQIAYLLRQMFAAMKDTLHAVIRAETLAEMLERAKWTIVQDEPPPEAPFRAKKHFTETDSPWRSGGFIVFENRRVFFSDDGYTIVEAEFQGLRETLVSERPAL